MENIICKISIVMCISTTHIITSVTTLFNKFLELWYNNIVTALAAYGFSKVVMYFFSAVKAKYNIMTFFICKFNYIIINKHTVCCESKTEILVLFLFNTSSVSDNLLYYIKIHKRFAAEKVNFKVYSAA